MDLGLEGVVGAAVWLRWVRFGAHLLKVLRRHDQLGVWERTVKWSGGQVVKRSSGQVVKWSSGQVVKW